MERYKSLWHHHRSIQAKKKRKREARKTECKTGILLSLRFWRRTSQFSSILISLHNYYTWDELTVLDINQHRKTMRRVYTEYVAQHLWFLIFYRKICSPNDVVKLDEPISSHSQVWTGKRAHGTHSKMPPMKAGNKAPDSLPKVKMPNSLWTFNTIKPILGWLGLRKFHQEDNKLSQFSHGVKLLWKRKTEDISMGKSVPCRQRNSRIPIPRCEALKEQRARLYIIRRCLYMLICWRENDD